MENSCQIIWGVVFIIDKGSWFVATGHMKCIIERLTSSSIKCFGIHKTFHEDFHDSHMRTGSEIGAEQNVATRLPCSWIDVEVSVADWLSYSQIESGMNTLGVGRRFGTQSILWVFHIELWPSRIKANDFSNFVVDEFLSSQTSDMSSQAESNQCYIRKVQRSTLVKEVNEASDTLSHFLDSHPCNWIQKRWFIWAPIYEEEILIFKL